ncbi:hypothetical protein CHS0354_021099, partial [Potamilus streckersoni]
MSESLTSSRELLQQIVTNTTPSKITMISVSSTNPEFSVNFQTAISASEIALAQLRVYNSWPDIRSKPFGGLPANNSLVFANKNKADGTTDWQVVGISTGSYQIEEINDEFQRRIKSITGKEAKIAITVYEPTLSAVIEENSPDYLVDIYESSIRSVLGWPEVAPVYNGVSESTKIEFKTSEEKFIKDPEYREKYAWHYIRFKFDPNDNNHYFTDFDRKRIPKMNRSAFNVIQTLMSRIIEIVNEEIFKEFFNTLKPEYDKAFNDLRNLLTSLSQHYDHNVKQQIIELIKHLNGILFDLYIANRSIINIATATLNNPYATPDLNQLFLNHYKIKENDLRTFIIPDLNNAEMKKSFSDLTEEYYPGVIQSWRKIALPPSILKHNNNPFGAGRHISPGIVNITTTIAVNLVCDVVDGSFQIDLSNSSQAQQG